MVTRHDIKKQFALPRAGLSATALVSTPVNRREQRYSSLDATTREL